LQLMDFGKAIDLDLEENKEDVQVGGTNTKTKTARNTTKNAINTQNHQNKLNHCLGLC